MRQDLAHFQQRDVLAETRPAPEPKVHGARVHDGQPLRAALQPPLGLELVGIGAPDLAVPVQHPRVDADVRARREVLAADGRAAGGDLSPEGIADSGVKAEGFLEDGLEVGELLALGERGGVGQLASGFGVVEFLAQGGQRGRVCDDVVECPKHGNTGGIAASHDITDAGAHHQRFCRRSGLLWVVCLLHSQEFGTEVGCPRDLFGIAVAVVQRILHLFDAGLGKSAKVSHTLADTQLGHVRHEGEKGLEQAEKLEHFKNTANRGDHIADILARSHESKPVGELLQC